MPTYLHLSSLSLLNEMPDSFHLFRAISQSSGFFGAQMERGMNLCRLLVVAVLREVENSKF